MELLEKFHKETLRSIQSFSKRTAIPAIYLLLGVLPVEGEIHRKKLTLLHAILACDNSKLKEILKRQISVNSKNPKSFFHQSILLLQQYNLPNILDSSIKLPSKVVWKKILRSTINKYWTYELQETAKSKSSLSLLNTTILEIGIVHPVWEFASQSLLDVQKSMIKARMLTGTYLVQADKYKFSQYKINATCLLCHREDEDLTHVLTFCPALRETRMKYFLPLKVLVTNIIGCKGWEQLFNINQNIVATFCLIFQFSTICKTSVKPEE
ncbi:Hypothetical predicted protein [Mytilus galloprovincialis]|uniref:Reverse transcriptase zinc-binding domain-containing protein n=1 Tax=Mytilus galloprovincialis TaxID=29158 RepID=A0A8B6FBW8_MYTGA|nr:Hypothetical predicted protein [Mytilus galloprovincialis]